MKPFGTLGSALVALFTLSGSPVAASGINVVKAPTGFFLPTDADKNNPPYYRGAKEDWGWEHGPVDMSRVAIASLTITAWDVNFWEGEHDLVQLFDADTSTWVDLGYLQGMGDQWSDTTFAIDLPTFADELADGLHVNLVIDLDHREWQVALKQSVVSAPDEGSTVAYVLVTALALLAWKCRRSWPCRTKPTGALSSAWPSC